MALKLSDLIIRDVWNVTGFDTVTGRPLFNLKNCNTTSFTSSADKVEITGGRGSPVLAVFTSEVKASLSVESATFDLNLLALQAGDSDGIYGTNVSVPISEKIIITDTLEHTATLKNTPSTNDIVSIILDDGTALVESDTVSATTFTVADKNLTFDASHKGKSGTAFYETIATDAVEITFDSTAPIEYCTLKVEITAQNQCDGLNYLGYIIMPRASIDKNFSIEAAKAGDGAVQNAVFDAVKTCGNTSLAKIVIYDADQLA